MTDDRLARWDRRHARGDAPGPPAPVLLDAVAAVPPGVALDVACGTGRHALALAERGWHVVAVDGSAVAIDRLRAAAAPRGLADRVAVQVADLEAEPPAFDLGTDAFDLIADLCFLHRPLFPHMRAALRPGGLLVAAIHVRVADRPAPHGFALAPGELAALVDGWGWSVLHHRQTDDGGAPLTELVARRPR